MNSTNSTHQPRGVGLAVKGLFKRYGNLEVLKDLSFQVNPGEVFVIMGPSGSGKTVLLKHLIGLEEPDSGQILVEGQSIQSAEVLSRYRMAMVFQSGALLNSLTVGENVGLYLTEHRLASPEEISRIVSDKLEVVGLAGTENKMPSELSGGMKKRVAIARSLVIEPQLIFYDEPTSELDPISALVIAEEIVRLNARINVTSLVVTHDRQLALGIADRIAVINEGRILAIGTPDEVRANANPLVQEFLNADLNTRKPLTK
jgi:phospholipid/cholesterol/gamma-HCH transport system ATP-binding protein